MKYVCMIYLDEARMQALPEPEMDALNAAHHRFDDTLVERGQMIAAGALAPASATTCVRVRKGKVSLVDGPFAETKEQVAGIFLVEARNLDEAIAIAAEIPSAELGTVEVRPMRPLVIQGQEYWCMDRIGAALEEGRRS